MEKDILEIGGRAIYEFRAHPKRAPWDKAAAETRASYRARMQELVNALSAAGYAIARRAASRKASAGRTDGESASRRR
jgi:Tfp pilus assembly protein FimV